jgi:hypothetical protein
VWQVGDDLLIMAPGEAPFAASPSRATMKYAITQNNAMKRWPPIRWAVTRRALARVALTRAVALQNEPDVHGADENECHAE